MIFTHVKKKKKRSLYFVVLFIHYEIKNKALYPNLTGTVKVWK